MGTLAKNWENIFLTNIKTEKMQTEMKNYHLSSKSKLLLSIICIAVISTGIYFGLEADRKAALSSFVHANQKPTTNCTFAIDAGHGSFLNNQYLTPGKQSPEWMNGLKVYEGYSNKLLATDLVSSLLDADMDAFILNSEAYNYSNLDRVQRVNDWLNIDKRIVLISLHHNAQDAKAGDYTDQYGIKGYVYGGATGIEVFTTIGKTLSDTLATLISYELMVEFPTVNFRADYKDKDPDKEANFTVIAQTKCPAVLIEFLFMTTFSDCRMIADDAIRTRYIQALTRALVKYNDSLN